MEKKKRVKCLYRVSTLKQVEGDDIPMQRGASRNFAALHPDWVITEEKVEKGISGFKTSANDRDAVMDLLDDARANGFDVLLVYMMDRLGRIADETSLVSRAFHVAGVEVWSVTEGQQHYDTHADVLMNFLRFWTAEGESRKTSIRTRTRLEQIVKEGRFRGGITPYGYRLEKQGHINARGNEVNEILMDETEAPVVARMFELSGIYGYGSRRIATTLTEAGIYNRNGRPFHPASIQNMLKNILYTGVLRSGESRICKSFPNPCSHGSRNKSLPTAAITRHPGSLPCGIQAGHCSQGTSSAAPAVPVSTPLLSAPHTMRKPERIPAFPCTAAITVCATKTCAMGRVPTVRRK